MITQESIIINSYSKPKIEIMNPEDISKIIDKDDSIVPLLFNKYFLTIAEIAALFDVCYQTMYKKMKGMGINTSSKQGRRNSSFGKSFSDERKANISKGNRGKTANHGYERTEEIRERISQTLKDGYKNGRIVVNRSAISKAWSDGKYRKSPMGRGIQGYFSSKKSPRSGGDIYFRSLLELNYLLLQEENDSVISIINEPVHIKLPNNGIYIPDFLINSRELIELKPSNHLSWTKDVNGRFDEEIRAAEKYCDSREWTYRVVYDSDIGFETNKFKRYLRNHQNLKDKYNIRFNNPEKVSWS